MECTLIHTYRTLFYNPNKLKIILESRLAVTIIKDTEGDTLNVTQPIVYIYLYYQDYCLKSTLKFSTG